MTPTSNVRQVVLDMKIARIIALYSEQHDVPLDEAADIYYKSITSQLIEEGAGDLHCRSDQYLVDELWFEVQDKAK